MAFIRVAGKTKTMALPVTTSTRLSTGMLLAWSSGLLVAATATTSSHNIVGVCKKTIESTDSDYATARLIPVEVPVEPRTVWEADVTSGLVAADIGLYVDLTDGMTINRGASVLDIAQVLKVLSTTKGHFHLNIGPEGALKT